MEHGLRGDVLAHAVPGERRLAPDMQTGELLLEDSQARMKGQRVADAGIDAAREARQPARARVVNRKIGGYTELRELRRR